jgi:ACT domain-containing protein
MIVANYYIQQALSNLLKYRDCIGKPHPRPSSDQQNAVAIFIEDAVAVFSKSLDRVSLVIVEILLFHTLARHVRFHSQRTSTLAPRLPLAKVASGLKMKEPSNEGGL